MNWREYHEATKHTAARLRQSQHFLDWANMPDPFRHYEGVPVLDLPADPPSPGTAALDVLMGEQGRANAADSPHFLSQLLYHSAAVSASKLVPSTGSRYALRVNPSSGNLHPTEIHFATNGLTGWPDGLYHYRVSSHMAEQRARGEFGKAATLEFLLTSIVWREAWKYRDRAYRYCLLDIGHAWEALNLTARAIGCTTHAIGRFDDDAIAQAHRLSEDEWPMLTIELRGPNISNSGSSPGKTIWFGGQPNPLSGHPLSYPSIERIHAATKLLRDTAVTEELPKVAGEIPLPQPARSRRPFGEVVRTRRSALDFAGGSQSITLPQLSAILATIRIPFSADFIEHRVVQLYLYVHRVDALPRGVYRYCLDRDALELIRSGDQRVATAGLSLGQDLAGNACLAFSMIADLERAARMYGDRAYRYAHFEAGAIGQRLYLAAESLGLRGTGMGAFFDDEVHRYLGLTPEVGQVVYHFAIGYPVDDPRLDA